MQLNSWGLWDIGGFTSNTVVNHQFYLWMNEYWILPGFKYVICSIKASDDIPIGFHISLGRKPPTRYSSWPII